MKKSKTNVDKQQDSAKAEALQLAQQARELQKHLKSLSKNQLIDTILTMADAQIESIKINRYLNEQLKKLQGELNAKADSDAKPAANP